MALSNCHLVGNRSTLLVYLTLVFIFYSYSYGRHHEHTPINKERVTDGAGHVDVTNKNAKDQGAMDHEAILGSKVTAGEFDHLPAGEAKRRLRVLAVAMDAIKVDGRVDRDELIRWILNSFKMLNKEDAEERHEESDTNDDGFITWAEYVDENYGIDPFSEGDQMQVEGQKMSPDKKMFLEDKELFTASDIDRDDQLSKDEFAFFANPEEFEHTNKILFKRTMEDRDVDGDGYLTFEEFLGDDGKGKDKEWHLVEKDRFDHDYDLDGDGRLNDEEVLLWLTPDDRESAEQEADHLIETADDDHDGSLTIEEIVDHHDAFVGSEATDFGEHLENLHKFKDEL